MTNYKYIIIGILLIGSIVLFNGLLHLNWPNQEDRGANIVQNDTRDSSTDLEAEDANADSQLPSLRDRILGRRETDQPGSNSSKLPTIENGQSPFQLPSGEQQLVKSQTDQNIQNTPAHRATPTENPEPIDEIVMPDFSHLETAILETDWEPFVAQTTPPRLLKIPDPPSLDPTWPRGAADDIPESNAIANTFKLPPSHAITPRQVPVQPKSGRIDRATPTGNTRPFSRATGIPFGLNQQARSELVGVHNRSDQVKPATTNFLDHKTKPGDSLQSLSDQYYGRPDFYLDIYIANQDKLINPATLPPGMTIKIPIFQD